MKKILLFVFLIIMVSGCSISFRAKTSNDLGVFRSDDMGETWVQKVFAGRTKKKEIKIDGVSVHKIVVSPDKESLYICTQGRGIYRSDDGGEVWQETGLRQGTYVNLVFDYENKEILYTAIDGKVLKSSNGGKNWDVVYVESQPGQVITDIATDHYDSKRIFISTNKGALIISEDYGNSWQVLKWFNFAIRKIYIDPSDSRIIYLITDGGGIMRTFDKGKSWQQIKESLDEFNGGTVIHSLGFNFLNPKEFYLATNYGLLKTENRGDSFTAVTTLIKSGNSIDNVFLDPVNPDIIFLTKDNKFHKSFNKGEEWQTKMLPSSGKVSDILVVYDKDGNSHIYLTIIKVKK